MQCHSATGGQAGRQRSRSSALGVGVLRTGRGEAKVTLGAAAHVAALAVALQYSCPAC